MQIPECDSSFAVIRIYCSYLYKMSMSLTGGRKLKYLLPYPYCGAYGYGLHTPNVSKRVGWNMKPVERGFSNKE